MTMKVQSLTDLQDRRIMLDRDVPPYGYAFVILVGIFMVFLLVWSTQTNRIYVSQNTGTVQASNKTYIMSSYSGSITEMYISEGSYVNEGDLVAHIKSTDIDMQQDNLESQLKIYQTQLGSGSGTGFLSGGRIDCAFGDLSADRSYKPTGQKARPTARAGTASATGRTARTAAKAMEMPPCSGSYCPRGDHRFPQHISTRMADADTQ